MTKPKGVGNNGNLIPPKKGEVRNPKGKPKGTKHIAHWIDEMLNDPKYATTIREGLNLVPYKGAPIKAMIAAQLHLAVQGDTKAFDVLAKYGYGAKVNPSDFNPVLLLLQKFELSGDSSDARKAPEA